MKENTYGLWKIANKIESVIVILKNVAFFCCCCVSHCYYDYYCVLILLSLLLFWLVSLLLLLLLQLLLLLLLLLLRPLPSLFYFNIYKCKKNSAIFSTFPIQKKTCIFFWQLRNIFANCFVTSFSIKCIFLEDMCGEASERDGNTTLTNHLRGRRGRGSEVRAGHGFWRGGAGWGTSCGDMCTSSVNHHRHLHYHLHCPIITFRNHHHHHHHHHYHHHHHQQQGFRYYSRYCEKRVISWGWRALLIDPYLPLTLTLSPPTHPPATHTPQRTNDRQVRPLNASTATCIR